MVKMISENVIRNCTYRTVIPVREGVLEKEYGLLRFVLRGDQGKYFSKYVISTSRGFYVKLRYSGENYGFADGPHYLYFIFLFLRH